MELDGEVNLFLDRALAVEEPSPDPSPSPDPDASPLPSPSPTPTPLAVQDGDLIALVQQVHQTEQQNRVNTSGMFLVLCLILTILVAAVLFSALRRR